MTFFYSVYICIHNIDEESCKTKCWECLTTCTTCIILLLSFGMFVCGTLMWSVINGHFGIADSIDNVICRSCVVAFTISTLILAIGSALTIFILICCFVANRHKFNFGLIFTMFYTLVAIIAIIIMIAAPIWLSRQSDIVQRFEDSSKVTFRNQHINVTIRETWNDYQDKFGCCGVYDYTDYYTYFGFNYTIPLSCCNLTTIKSEDIDCSRIVKHVTKADVSSYYIYGRGCPIVIIDMLKLNSTTIHDVGIFAAAGSAFVLVSVIVIFISTMIVVPDDNEQRLCLAASVFIMLFAIMKVCSAGK